MKWVNYSLFSSISIHLILSRRHSELGASILTPLYLLQMYPSNKEKSYYRLRILAGILIIYCHINVYNRHATIPRCLSTINLYLARKTGFAFKVSNSNLNWFLAGAIGLYFMHFFYPSIRLAWVHAHCRREIPGKSFSFLCKCQIW